MIVRKKGQQVMGLSFGMIFAIFLMVVFFAIAFIAVKSFLDLGRTSNVGLFYEEFQEEIDDAWASQSSETTFKIDLPDGIKKVCFADFNAVNYEEDSEVVEYEIYEEANTFLIPFSESQGLGYKYINHLDIENTTSSKNPYCVDVDDGIKIKKDFYDRLVIVV
jgi:hypothetical protein